MLRRPRLPSERASLLIMVMLLAGAIAVSLTSFLRIASQTHRNADRGFQGTAALNLAESGAERALYCFNRSKDVGVATAWTGWTTSGANAWRKFSYTSAELGTGATADVRVYVQGYDNSAPNPVVVVKATINLARGAPIDRFLRLELKRRSFWSWGLVAKDTVRLNSNARTDSWNSNSPSATVAYPGAGQRDNGSVGVVSATDGALALDSNAEIYGTANSGGGTITAIGNTRIYGATSPRSPKVDASRVNRDFSFTFPAITVPNPDVGSFNSVATTITSNTTLPRVGDVAAADGKYYYRFASGAMVNLSSNRTLTINNVSAVLLFESHSGGMSLQLNSNANFNLSGANAAATIYTNGNVLADSNNSLNVGRDPSKLVLYGINSAAGGQSFVFNSNVQLYGLIYAPNGNVRLDSNTDVFGSIVALTSQMDSNSELHYDEALGNLTTGNPYGVSRWFELQSAAERTEWADELNF